MKDLQEKIRKFSAERNWDQFHAPKNLAIGVCVEAGELQEIFMWLNETESWHLTSEQLNKVQDEVGDVMIYLVNLCGKLDIDPIECAIKKLEKNNIKYPIDKSYGKAVKYTDF